MEPAWHSHKWRPAEDQPRWILGSRLGKQVGEVAQGAHGIERLLFEAVLVIDDGAVSPLFLGPVQGFVGPFNAGMQQFSFQVAGQCRPRR